MCQWVGVTGACQWMGVTGACQWMGVAGGVSERECSVPVSLPL